MTEQINPNLLEFPRLGIAWTVKNVAFSIGNFSITWYGILIATGFLLALLYVFARIRSFGLDVDRAVDGIIGGGIGGILGARTYYVMFHWDEFQGNIKHILNVRGGGLAIYGGVIGALLIGTIVCKCRKVRLAPMYDLTALGLLIGQTIGRWGNFANHEAFGCNTTGLFGMTSAKIQTYIRTVYPDGSIDPMQPVHPCFFYESMWCLAGFILLHIISKKWRKFDGQIFLMYIVWYGAGRFFIEGLRTDSLYLGTIRVSQAVAAISVVVGIILLLVCFSRVRRMGSDYKLYFETEESKQLLEEADRKEQEYQERKAAKKASAKPQEEAPTESESILSEESAEEHTKED